MAITKMAKSQNSCITPSSIIVDGTPINQSQSLNQNWYVFNATDNYLFVNLLPVDNTFYGIDSITIYNGDCASLSVVSLITKNLTDTVNMLELYLNGLIVNNNYYIKVSKKTYSVVNYNLSVFKTLATSCDLINNSTFNAFGFGACPTAPGTITLVGVSLTNGWFANNSGTPDFYNSCNTSTASTTNPNYIPNGLIPVTGGYFGLHCGAPSNPNLEYMSGSLAVGMTTGKKYYVSMDYAKTPRAKYSVNKFGMSLSVGLPSNTTGNLGFTPAQPWQVTSTGLSQLTNTVFATMGSCYQATGGENFITIGNSAGYSSTTFSVANPSGYLGSSDYLIDNVHAIPLDLDISPTTSICLGASATLTTNLHCPLPIGVVTNTAGVITNSLFVWTPTVGLSVSTGTATIATPTATTIFTITLTIPPINSNGSACTITNTVQVTISTPTINITAPSTTICLGNSTTLTASGASTYTWSTGANTSSIAVTPSITTTYTVTGANTSGCVSTKTVTIYVAPNFTLTATASPTAICAGNSTTLTASGASTYTWNPGSLSGATLVVTPTITTTYTITGSNGGCINTKTLTVLVNPKPTVTITASSATVCAGSTVTLTATAGLSAYSWSPCSLACNTNSLTFMATNGLNTYSCAVTGTNGCTNTAVKTITAVASPTLSVNSASICSGNTATLTASGASAYTWTPGAATGSMVVVSPTVTTNYTVTGINVNGCYAIAISTVTIINTTTINVTTTASNVNPIVGTPITLYASVTPSTNTYTYNWTPGSITTVSAVITPTDNAVYTCNVTNQCGNTTSAIICINVESTLCNTTSNITLTNAVLTNTTVVLANKVITINGTLNLINTDLTLNTCTLKMGTNAKIIIDPTSRLTTSALTKIFSCESMWYGIEVQKSTASAAVININETTIEDAWRGIDASNTLYTTLNIINVNRSTFNKNYIDININTGNGGRYPLTVIQSTLSSNTSTTSPGSNLKCSSFYSPSVKNRSFAGLYTENAGKILFDNTNVAGYVNNSIKNKDYGLYFNNTSAQIYNVNFDNFNGYRSTSLSGITTNNGVAIRSESSPLLSVKPTTTPVAGALTFNNTCYGILANSTQSVDVQYADFTNPSQYSTFAGLTTNGIGLNSILINDASGLLRLNFNTFQKAYSPITANFVSSALSTFSLSISQNTLNASTGTITTAMTVQSSVNYAATAGSMFINGNSITNANNGIYVNNINNGLRLSTNTVSVAYFSVGARAGMRLNGCSNVTVDNNSISSTNTANANLRGIYLQLSPACKTQCNTVTNVGQGFVFEGNCLSTTDGFINNTINGANDGMVLKTNGVIGMQGATGGATPGSSGNQWLGTFTNSKTLVTDVGSSAQNSNLILRNNANEYPQPQSMNKVAGSAVLFSDNFGVSPNVTPSTMVFVTTNNYGCLAARQNGLRLNQSAAAANYEQAMQDSALFKLLEGPGQDALISDETREINRRYVYSILDADYTTNHAGLIAFYNSQSDSAVANYMAVDSLLDTENYNAAQTQNNNAPVNSQIQYNQQLVNDALIKYGINPQSAFTQTDLDELMALANSCPLQQGNSVYQARSLMCVVLNSNINFDDACEFKSSERKAIKNTNVINNYFNVYPNPNSGSMYLKYTIVSDASIKIYDVSGRNLYQHHLSSSNSILDINTNLSNGIYFYAITDEAGNVLKNDKLIIMK